MFYITFDWCYWNQAWTWTYFCYEEGRVGPPWPESQAWPPGRPLQYQTDGCSDDALAFFLSEGDRFKSRAGHECHHYFLVLLASGSWGKCYNINDKIIVIDILKFYTETCIAPSGCFMSWFPNKWYRVGSNLRNTRGERTFAVLGGDFSCCSKPTGGTVRPQIFSYRLTGSWQVSCIYFNTYLAQ